MEIQIKETRGRKRKHDFSGMEIGGRLIFKNIDRQIIMSSSHYYLRKNNLGWKLRSWVEENGDVIVVRVQ